MLTVAVKYTRIVCSLAGSPALRYKVPGCRMYGWRGRHVSRVTPKARSAQVSPFEPEEGVSAFLLQDPTGFAKGPLVASAMVPFVLSRCDGRTTVEEIQKEGGTAKGKSSK